MWNQSAGCFMGIGQWLSSHWIGGFGLKMLIVIALAFLLYKLIRSGKTAPRENQDARDSLVLLENRLAEGKISSEEYQNIRNILCR